MTVSRRASGLRAALAQRSSLVALAATLVGCAPSAPASSAAVVPTLQVVADLWPGYYPVHLARSRFADSAVVRIRVVEPEDSDRMLAEFAAGRYDVVASSFTDLVSLQQIVPDLRVIMCTDESVGADGIVARAGITDVQQLRGKRVGVNLGGFAELLVDAMLRAHGMTSADVRMMDIDAAQVPAALRDGRIDAGETWNPYLATLPREGFRVLYSSAQTPGLIQDCIATRESVAAQSPAALRELVRAWTAAAEWTIANPDSARHALQRLLNREIPPFADSTGVHVLSLRENWQRLADTLPISLARIGRRHAEFLGRVGALRAPARIDVLIDLTFLPARLTATAPAPAGKR